MASTSTEIRRTGRQKKPSLKAVESLYLSKLKKSGFLVDISDEENLEEALFLSEEELAVDIEKPKLLHNNEVVHGKKIFAFQTRKQKDSLAQKVAEACNQKTPHVVRHKMKSRIAAKMLEDSGSEYECSSTAESSEDKDSEDSEEDMSDESSESDGETVSKHPPQVKFTNTAIQLDKKRTRKTNTKYTIKTEEYFSNFSSSKIKTSNNTLDKLETPRLPHYQLQKLLSTMRLSREHDKSISRLSETNKGSFKKWLYLLHENFNILLYGLGSKRNLLNSFHLEFLKDLPVVVINGFFPTLAIKNILDGIIVDLLGLTENPANINEACDLIIQEFKCIPETHLYLIIHNIEGEMLRNSKAQNILAKLAAVKNIHLIASIDHINAPLIWDHNKLSKFNYIWCDVTSFLPYTEETSFEKSMMIQQTGTLALSSLRNVFLSLTTNSKAIYHLIAEHQIKNSGAFYQGLPFKDLYLSCREAFIVSSDLALRAQLTEFVDHKMVKLKRSADGAECITIPLANSLLQKFMDENKN